MEVTFVEETGPVSSAPQTLEEPAPSLGEEIGAPEEASGAVASSAEALPEPVPEPEPVRAPTETGERRRPDITRNAVPIRPPVQTPVPQRSTRTAEAAPRPPVRRPQLPAPTPGQGQRQRDTGWAERLQRSLGRGAPQAQGASPQPQAAAVTPQVRASIRSVIASELNNPRCRNQPFPAPEARAIQVTMTVSLGRDGGVAGTSNIRISNDNPNLARYEGRVRELALALLRCAAPFQRLAGDYSEYYSSWRQFPYRFPIRN
jgi:hypothetical protein